GTTGVITTYVGGAPQSAADGVLAANVLAFGGLSGAGQGMAFDSGGNLSFCNYGENRIRRVDHSTTVVTTTAGNPLYTADGGAALSASVVPSKVVEDAAGNLFVADAYSRHVRRVDAVTGVIDSYAGNFDMTTAHRTFYASGDGGPATSA